MMQHQLFAHGPWLETKYGILGIWGTQGTKKSHKLARTMYHRCTQKGGSSNNQMFFCKWVKHFIDLKYKDLRRINTFEKQLCLVE